MSVPTAEAFLSKMKPYIDDRTVFLLKHECRLYYTGEELWIAPYDTAVKRTLMTRKTKQLARAGDALAVLVILCGNGCNDFLING